MMAYSPAGEEFIINIPLSDIPSELPAAEWPECCIYRAPKILRKVNEEAYTPKLISIGPFHHHRKELWDMQMHKLRYFKDFLKRTGKSMEDLLEIIKVDKEKINHCYSEDCILGRDDYFVKMILLDAIFIIELFLKVKKKKREDEENGQRKIEEEDYILRKIWLANGIYYDLLLLENQLPFFVLEKLYKFAGFSDSPSSCNHHEEGKLVEEHKENLKTRDAPIVKLFRNYFTYYDQMRKSIGEEVIVKPTGKEKTERPIGEEVKHFTDLLRYLFCPQKMEERWERKKEKWSIEGGCMCSSKNKKRRESGTQFCATKLDDAGLKFNVINDRRLLDITIPGCSGRYPCFGLSCLVACFPCLICLICFPSLTCLLRCFRCFKCPMHIFKFPQLVIDCNTEAIFRNLMALEQCHYPSKTYICSYVLLLDRLIDTEEDVDLLVNKKVIAHRLGSNAEVATLINKLGCRIVAPTPSYFENIAQKLNDHYEFPLNHFLATLKREYFTNVFRGTATIVGLIVLGFTFWSFIRSFVDE
jgi:hypothetical protein